MPTGLQIAPPSLIDKANQQSVIELVRRQLAEVRGTDDWAIRATVGWPADSLVSVGQTWPASLIVLGLGKHGLANRLLGAETAVLVARRSVAPVLAVPRDCSRLPIRAVAAIDFTESSVNAATLAADLLGPAGSLTLVHASVLAKDAPPPGSLPDVYTTGARDKLDAIREQVQRGTKRRVQSLLVNDDVVDGLLNYVDSDGCDLLALGGHDMGLVDRFLLGSVRSRVLRHAQCAVLIAPHVHDAGE
jgi:nucleotide-binding universal stress UspA family protein